MNVHHWLLIMILHKKIHAQNNQMAKIQKHIQKFINKFYLLSLSVTKCVNLRNKKLLARDTTVKV